MIFRIGQYGAASLILAGFATSGATAAQTKSYVVSWLTQAAYSQDGDCPDGLNLDSDAMYRRELKALGKSPDEIDALMKQFDGGNAQGLLRDLVMNRARVDGKPVNVY